MLIPFVEGAEMGNFEAKKENGRTNKTSGIQWGGSDLQTGRG